MSDSSINLLPKDKQPVRGLASIRHWAVLATSIALVLYLVVTAAFLGWWLFLATQDSLTTSQISKVEEQIRQISATEALVREAGKRAELIQGFLGSRVDVASVAASINPTEQVSVVNYSYSQGLQSLTASVTQLSEMEKYTERLKTLYPNIINTSVTNTGSPTWSLVIKL